jgi:hypothetical protein
LFELVEVLILAEQLRDEMETIHTAGTMEMEPVEYDLKIAIHTQLLEIIL